MSVDLIISPSQSPDAAGQPHLVSLVLQSKKALQVGEQLCSRAHAANQASAQAAVDVLALDAKVRWIGKAVVDQLKLAAGVAKAIEEKRTHLNRQIREWDDARAKRMDALDDILTSLGAHLVPPEFHQTSPVSSLFGSQLSSPVFKKEVLSPDTSRTPTTPTRPQRGNAPLSSSPVSPSATLRRHTFPSKAEPSAEAREARKEWKTLRDFANDQAIEELREKIDNDRLVLDAILGKIDDYPETLTKTINTIQSNLPLLNPTDSNDISPTLRQMQEIISSQEGISTSMANLLESLASHYDEMAKALKETEGGEVFAEEDLQTMNRDTDELPAIMSELEQSANAIDRYHKELADEREKLQASIEYINKVLLDLDELGDIMNEMLETQEVVEAQALDELDDLHQHLSTLEGLHDTFASFRTAFNKLVLEIARRRQYREAAENIVEGMMRQLRSMTDEEARVREHFNAEYGSHLPEDLCLCIGNKPTVWEVVPLPGSAREFLPTIDGDLVNLARDRVGVPEPGAPGADSL